MRDVVYMVGSLCLRVSTYSFSSHTRHHSYWLGPTGSGWPDGALLPGNFGFFPYI